MFGTNSLLPGTLTSDKLLTMFSGFTPNFSATQMAARELYTLNLPGIQTFTLSFLSPNFTLKSEPVLAIVISLANKSQ